MTPVLAIAPNAIVAVAAVRALTHITSRRRRAALGALALVRRARAHAPAAISAHTTPLTVG